MDWLSSEWKKFSCLRIKDNELMCRFMLKTLIVSIPKIVLKQFLQIENLCSIPGLATDKVWPWTHHLSWPCLNFLP